MAIACNKNKTEWPGYVRESILDFGPKNQRISSKKKGWASRAQGAKGKIGVLWGQVGHRSICLVQDQSLVVPLSTTEPVFRIYAMFDVEVSRYLKKYFRLVLLHGPFSGHILWSDKLDEKLELPLQAEHSRHQYLLRAHLYWPSD